jgi:hypothetical protein
MHVPTYVELEHLSGNFPSWKFPERSPMIMDWNFLSNMSSWNNQVKSGSWKKGTGMFIFINRMYMAYITLDQEYQIFLGTVYQDGRKYIHIPHDHKITIAWKYTKWP